MIRSQRTHVLCANANTHNTSFSWFITQTERTQHYALLRPESQTRTLRRDAGSPTLSDWCDGSGVMWCSGERPWEALHNTKRAHERHRSKSVANEEKESALCVVLSFALLSECSVGLSECLIIEWMLSEWCAKQKCISFTYRSNNDTNQTKEYFLELFIAFDSIFMGILHKHYYH